MLDLIGFLSVMGFWWGTSILFVIYVCLKILHKYFTDIENHRLAYLSKAWESLIFKQDKFSDEVDGVSTCIILLGLIFLVISVANTYITPGHPRVWDMSVAAANTTAPYAWWLLLFLVYPLLVAVGKAVSRICRVINRLDSN